jgi:hypothetical protein
MRKSIITVDSFFKEAPALRQNFEDRFKDPREARSDRFVWDYWHVPGQYTTLRTPAYHFFPQKVYERFHNQLVWWGRRQLGCHDISPPWMSCYIDGCKQELHGDLPHGPWAFVYSLTPWKQRKFRGGETILLKEEILTYWQGFQSTRSVEEKDILTSVPPLFNRLTVFDPRIPHGVRGVEGVRDIVEGRLVIHGWFVQPRPFIEGPLATKDLQTVIDDLSGELNDLFVEGMDIHGTLSVRMAIAATGQVTKVETLSNALRHPGGDARIEKALVKHIHSFLMKASFRRRRATSMVTLPLVFEAV